jgi:hypothetical protein
VQSVGEISHDFSLAKFGENLYNKFIPMIRNLLSRKDEKHGATGWPPSPARVGGRYD